LFLNIDALAKIGNLRIKQLSGYTVAKDEVKVIKHGAKAIKSINSKQPILDFGGAALYN